MLSNKSSMIYPHVNHVGTGTLPPANMIYFFTDDRNKITEHDLSGNSHYAGIGKRHVLLLHEWHFPVTNIKPTCGNMDCVSKILCNRNNSIEFFHLLNI